MKWNRTMGMKTTWQTKSMSVNESMMKRVRMIGSITNEKIHVTWIGSKLSIFISTNFDI